MKENLKSLWENIKRENPKVRIREAAKMLNVSEAELLITNVGLTTTILKPEFKNILQDIESLGYVMALTRNDHCVHERKGIYKNLSFQSPHVALAVNPDIDLRIFINKWHFAFAVNEDERKSLQFFSQNGTALHKIYLTEKSNVDAFNDIVAKYKIEDEVTELNIQYQTIDKVEEKPDSEIDIESFQNAWIELKDTHDFYILLKKFGLSRTQALRLAPKNYTKKITLFDVKSIFSNISKSEAEVMIFVSNEGIIQIHTGKTINLLETGKWFNVLDDEFSMHLNTESIHSAWLVKKPTDDVVGCKTIINSVELYDKHGGLILQIFGKRKPGIPESTIWQEIVTECTSKYFSTKV